MNNAKRKARSSNLESDWELYETKRKELQKENRRRRVFVRRSEAVLKRCPNSAIFEAIKREKERREVRKRTLRMDGKALVQESFTAYVGSYYDQDKEVVALKSFAAPALLEGEIKASIKRARPNKYRERDGIQYEMLKVEVPLMEDLILETCNLIGW